MIEARRVAAAVAEAKVVHLLASPGVGRNDQLDLGALVVALAQVEANRPPAARAIVAIALAQRPDALRLLLAAALPRADVPDDGRTRHEGAANPRSLLPG